MTKCSDSRRRMTEDERRSAVLQRRVEEGGGGAYPGLTFVVIYSHLGAAAHADDGVDGAQAIEPDIHDADFDFGGAEWRLHYRTEIYALLENVLIALMLGYGCQLFRGGSDDYSGAGE